MKSFDPYSPMCGQGCIPILLDKDNEDYIEEKIAFLHQCSVGSIDELFRSARKKQLDKLYRRILSRKSTENAKFDIIQSCYELNGELRDWLLEYFFLVDDEGEFTTAKNWESKNPASHADLIAKLQNWKLFYPRVRSIFWKHNACIVENDLFKLTGLSIQATNEPFVYVLDHAIRYDGFPIYFCKNWAGC